MRIAGFIFAIIAACSSQAALAKTPQHVVDQIRERAVEAGFDGAILVGQKDGSQAAIALGDNPPSTRAIWRWASITKQLTAVLAMQEVERDRLDLDAPVSRYWPEWKAPNAGKIRIRDLLLHNSGLPQPDASAPDSDGVPAFYRSAAATPANSANGFCAGPARAAPPAPFEYDNCDTIVLAQVLAKVTGRSFEQLVRERFGRKLGLRSLGIYNIDGRRFGHVEPTGEYRDVDALINLGVNGASAGAYGTIADLWKFDHALLSGKLLGPSARETMWQSSRENGFYGFFQWIYPAPLKGCGKDVRIVERQGLVGGIELRNYLLPETGQALIMFGRKRPVGIGDPWEGKGFAFDLLSTVACGINAK